MISKSDLWDKLRELGCIVCLSHRGIEGVPASIHHLLDGNRRISDHCVIPLCGEDHQYGTKGNPSRHSQNGCHGGKAAFEAMYGSELALLAECEQLIGVPYWSEREKKPSKIARRLV